MKVDLNLFTLFDVIYREGNLTKAATALNLSQPAVSHALARLRVHFGDDLFVRQGKLMRPTPVAKNVIADVREALHQLQVTLIQAKQFDPSSSKKQCTLSLHGTLESAYLPCLMSRLLIEAPKMTLTSTRIQRHELTSKLASGELDLAIDVLIPVDENIKHTQLEQDELVVVVAKRHAEISSQLSLTRYLEQNHILVSSRASGSGFEDFELGRLGLQRKVALRCQNYFSACRVVEDSDMLLTMPKTAALMFSKTLAIAIYPLPVTLPAIDIHLYWHSNVDKEPANKWLRNKVLMAVANKFSW